METTRLTQFSHGAGCGCKLSPKVLEQILKETTHEFVDPRLLVGNGSRDDAAVYDLDGRQALISTTDFFTPIVDDAFTFGRIAAANAISDVYAMGGRPVLAIAVLGWPVAKLPPELAGRVVDGGRDMCREAGIPLAGGHSIDSPEPIFGLAVTGLVDHAHLKRNDGACPGDQLFLTKGLGVGLLTTAEKRGVLKAEDEGRAAVSMTELNRVGEAFGRVRGVTAMTDVTGFGLLGHLRQMCVASGTRAELLFECIPRVTDLSFYLSNGTSPGGTQRNWDSYGHDIEIQSDVQRNLLCDPQTNGGLLLSVRPDSVEEVKSVLESFGLARFGCPIGRMMTSPAGSAPRVTVRS